jgi:hypothetical protein
MIDKAQTTDRPAEAVGDEARETAGSDEPAGKEAADRPREIGGRKGPDPTRYGDWEKNGRCIDF